MLLLSIFIISAQCMVYYVMHMLYILHMLCRFETEEKAGRHPCCFIPMGIGPRNCVGLKLAKFIMKMTLTSLLQKYRFTRTNQTEDKVHTKCCSLTLSVTSKVYVGLQPRK